MSSLIFLLVSLLLLSVTGVTSRNFIIENKCDYNVWPGVLTTTVSNGIISTTGFALKKGETHVINATSGWRGSFWGRSICSTSSSTNKFSCATGDCGSGKIECSGGSAAPPMTLAEFYLDGPSGQDYYDISLVDGYNLPLMVVPQSQACPSIGCLINLTTTCPTELVRGSSGEGEPIACMNACQKFNTDLSCCRGEYSTPQTCSPSDYSKIFKNECPDVYTYAWDDTSSTFACSSKPNYVITFCPPVSPNNKTGSSKAEPPFPSQTKNGILKPPSEPPFPSQTKNGILEPPSGSSQSFKETNTNTKHISSWKLKLILGVSAGLTVMIITIGVIIMKTKDVTKGDWNDRNVESVVMLKR